MYEMTIIPKVHNNSLAHYVHMYEKRENVENRIKRRVMRDF